MATELGKAKETDVKAIRSLIDQNTDLARGIRVLAEQLHTPLQDAECPTEPPISPLVGAEFIELLKIQRRMLEAARDALQGFNG